MSGRRGLSAPPWVALAAAVFLFAPAPLWAQAQAKLVVPPGEYTVGDPIVLTLSVSHPAGAVFDPPDLTPLMTAGAPDEPKGKGEGAAPLAVEPAQIQKKEPPDPRQTVWTIRVRPFVTGEIPIPALTLRYDAGGSGGKVEVHTEATGLRVASVLKAPDEPAADIRGPWRLPRAWWLALLAAAAALAALGATYVWWRRRRSRPAPEPEAPPAPPPEITPYERAMRDLLALLEGHLLAEGRLKEFHVRLSEIVKTFLGGHLRFDAVDRTTVEVLIELERVVGRDDLRAGAREFLEACDLVKFAKHHPGPAGIDETVQLARALISIGRPVPQEGPQEVVAA